MFEISIQRTFSAAHALRLPDGSYEPTHGHDWRVTVVVASEKLDDIDTVMDFHILEPALDAIIGPWHHHHLNEVAPFADADGHLAINPSAERVVWHIGQTITPALPEGVTLVSVTVTEAPGCAATYRPV